MTKIVSVLGVNLTISDNAGDLEAAIDNGMPIIAVIDDDPEVTITQAESLPFTRFAITYGFLEETEDVKNRYYERVVLRHLGRPITIAGDDCVTIRELCSDDVPILIRIYEDAQGAIEPFYDNEEEVGAFLEEYTKNVYELSPYGFYGITDNTLKLIGIVGVVSKDNHFELSYALLKENEGKGYGIRACELALKACNVENELIVVNIKQNNTRSINLANKLSKSFRIKKRILS